MTNLSKHYSSGLIILLSLLITACGGGGANLKQTEETVAATTQEASLSVRESFADAVALLDIDDYQGAIDILEQINSQNDQLAGVHANLGIAYGQLEKYTEAKDALETAVSLNADNPQILNAMALAYRNSGDFNAAKETYIKNIEINPGNVRTHLNLGILCDIYMNDLTCAIDNYKAYEAIYQQATESAEAASQAQAEYEKALADKAERIALAEENGEDTSELEEMDIPLPSVEVIPLPDDPKNEKVVFWIEDLEKRNQ